MKRKILFIEDDDDLRATTKELLDDFGFETLAAASGAQGVQLAIQHSPDVIVCDINMPQITGYEVYNMLHQITSTSVIPFIFLSAKSSKEDILAGMHLGVDDYITKPFEVDQLVAVINRRIENRQRIEAEHEEKFNTLFKNISTGACILKMQTFEYVNQPLVNLLGYSPEELEGLSITNIIHSDSLPKITQTLENCFEGLSKTFSVKIKAICKNQSIVKLELRGSQIRLKGEPKILCTFSKEDDDQENVKKVSKANLPKLSEREIEVLDLICQGFSNSEISEKLFISERTVEGHRSRLFSKTGTKNAVALAMWAVKNNLVDVN